MWVGSDCISPSKRGLTQVKAGSRFLPNCPPGCSWVGQGRAAGPLSQKLGEPPRDTPGARLGAWGQFTPHWKPLGAPLLEFLCCLLVMEMWMTMGKISILCRVWTLCSWTSRRAWVFWRGQGRESGSQPGQVVEPTHSPEGTRRAAVCSRGALRGVCWGPWRLAASILISRSALPASCYHPPVEMQSPSPQHSCQPRPLPCL